MNNNISFTSRINFVNAKTFENFQKGTYIDFRPNNELSALDMLMLKPSGKIKHPRIDVLKADEFYTDTVRTCTAGGVINSKTGEAVGFHIFDSLDNLEKIDDILENIFGNIENPDRALLLGSKKLKFSTYSGPIFKKIYNGIAKRIENITLFKEHSFPYSESDIHYSARNDTWTIHSMYKPLTDYKEYDIKSKEDLDKCFKKIILADGDTLSFNNI